MCVLELMSLVDFVLGLIGICQVTFMAMMVGYGEGDG